MHLWTNQSKSRNLKKKKKLFDPKHFHTQSPTCHHPPTIPSVQDTPNERHHQDNQETHRCHSWENPDLRQLKGKIQNFWCYLRVVSKRTWEDSKTEFLIFEKIFLIVLCSSVLLHMIFLRFALQVIIYTPSKNHLTSLFYHLLGYVFTWHEKRWRANEHNESNLSPSSTCKVWSIIHVDLCTCGLKAAPKKRHRNIPIPGSSKCVIFFVPPFKNPTERQKILHI